MTERFYSPVIKYTTSNLTSLPGALLYFYETGTTTPKTTWSDPERDTASAHPVVALADGTFPPIFINGIYRVELKNAAGTTQPGWPVDDVGTPATGSPFQEWSSTYSYSQDDIISYSGSFYISLTNSNVGNTPSSSPLNWQKILLIYSPTAESFLNGNANGTYTWETIAQTKSSLSLPTDTASDLAARPRAVDTFADLGTVAAEVDQVIDTLGHTLPGVDSARFRARSGNVTSDNATQIDALTANVYWYKFAENKIGEVIRDINAKTSPAFNVGGLINRCMLKKLRTDYLEFAIYTPMTVDGKYWARWLFTNRFNLSVTGAAGSGGAIPRMIMCTLAAIFPSTEITKVTENTTTGTTTTAAINTYNSASGVYTGTYVGPATISGVTDTSYSATVGDFVVWTTTGNTRIVLRAANVAANGGIGYVRVFTDVGLTTEISAGLYQIPVESVTGRRLISSFSFSEGLKHIPIASGLTPASTYYIKIQVDATNAATKRVYTSGLLGYAAIAYNAVSSGKGIHGVVDDAELPGSSGQFNSRSYNSGTRVIYTCTSCTKIDWRYVETTSGSIVTFLVYDSVGALISTYVNSSVDTYAPGSTAKKITVAEGLTLGTYYLHITNGLTRNASNVVAFGYRYYDFGVITYDQTTAGTIEVDDFDDFDVPNVISDPNNDSGNGTDYLLIGTGNLELAISARKTTEAIGDEEFLGGIHGFETTPTPVFYGDGSVVDFAGGAQFATWFAGEFGITMSTTLKFPVDASNFCSVDYVFMLSQSGYGVTTTKTTLANSYIHNDYSIMMNVPNTDMTQVGKPSQGLLTGGGFEKVAADINYIINDYDNSSTLITPHQQGVAFVNNEYMAMCGYTMEPVRPVAMTVYPFSQGNYKALIQDRTDRTIKYYTKAFDGDATNGVLVPSGTSYSDRKTYRPGQGNFKNLVGHGI